MRAARTGLTASLSMHQGTTDMRVTYAYRQRAIVEYTGELEIPESVADEGKDAVEQYIKENEHIATKTSHTVSECCDDVEGSMTVREISEGV